MGPKTTGSSSCPIYISGKQQWLSHVYIATVCYRSKRRTIVCLSPHPSLIPLLGKRGQSYPFDMWVHKAQPAGHSRDQVVMIHVVQDIEPAGLLPKADDLKKKKKKKKNLSWGKIKIKKRPQKSEKKKETRLQGFNMTMIQSPMRLFFSALYFDQSRMENSHKSLVTLFKGDFYLYRYITSSRAKMLGGAKRLDHRFTSSPSAEFSTQATWRPRSTRSLYAEARSRPQVLQRYTSNFRRSQIFSPTIFVCLKCLLDWFSSIKNLRRPQVSKFFSRPWRRTPRHRKSALLRPQFGAMAAYKETMAPPSEWPTRIRREHWSKDLNSSWQFNHRPSPWKSIREKHRYIY